MVVILYLLVVVLTTAILMWVYFTYKERKDQSLFGRILFERELRQKQQDYFDR